MRVSTRFDVHGMGRFTVELNETDFGLVLDHGHSDRVMLMGLPKTHGWRAITPVHLAHQSYVENVEDWLEEVVWPRAIAALEVDTGEWQTVWEGGVIGGERQSWLPRHVQGCEGCRAAVGEGRFDRCSECRDARLVTDGGTVEDGRYQVDVLDGWPLVLYQDAREAWGHEPQITLAQEELAELNVELARHFRGRNDSEDVIDEIADVLIAVNQLALIFGLGETEARVEYKLQRLRKRVDEHQDGDRDE